ncbi:MAG: hypothetical protein ACTSVB_09115 [Candidatus Heimdallarchaeaceae archaeon]
MSNSNLKVKPGDIKINNSIINFSFLYPLDFSQLFRIFNEAGYEAVMPILKDKGFQPFINIVDTEKFRLNYYPEKKLLELISDSKNISEVFSEIIDTIQLSDYNILNNLTYCEIVSRTLNIESEEWKTKLKDINIDFINKFAEIFNFKKLNVNRIGFTNSLDPLTVNWFGVNILPVNALGENYYTFEIVYRSDNIDSFRNFLKSLKDNSDKSIFGDKSG